MNSSISGYNGQRLNPFDGLSHLGNGYRAYNPVLMRFQCPDNLTPFSTGGSNTYVYCADDPINRSDPSGHHSVGGWLGIGIGVAMSLLLTPVSGGSSLAVALSILSVASAAVSTGLAIAQQFAEEANPQTGAALGWAAMGAGLVSGISSVALSRVAPGAKSLVSLLKGTSNRPLGGLMMTGENAVSVTGGQFRNPRFIGVYPAREEPGHLLAFSFEDEVRAGTRLTIYGQPAVTDYEYLALGSGQWSGGRYHRRLLSYRKIARLINEAVRNNPDIRRIRLAIPYASTTVGNGCVSFTVRVRSSLPRHNFGGRNAIRGAIESFELRGPVVEELHELQNSLHYDRDNNLLTVNDNLFSPDTAQGILDYMSGEYGDMPGAFEIVGGRWR